MTEREEVAEAVRTCVQPDSDCGVCPYSEMEGLSCIHALRGDILALLKAQEPRVIQFDEIDDYEVLWLEVRDVETEDGLAPWVKTASGRWFSPLLCSEVKPDMILSTPDEYGRICRCWTSRPTDEQREATAW